MACCFPPGLSQCGPAGIATDDGAADSVRSGSNHRSCVPGLCWLPWRQRCGNNLRHAPCPPPVTDTVMCGYIPGGAPDKQLCFTKFNGCLLYTSDAADDLLCVDLGG